MPFRWPSAKKFYDEQSKGNERNKSGENEQDKSEANFIKAGKNCVRQLRNYVSLLTCKHYSDNDTIDNFTSLNQIFHVDERFNEIIGKSENPMNILFCIDEFKSILSQSSR